MPIEQTSIDGLLVVRWDTHDDDRGFFRQTYQVRELDDALDLLPTATTEVHADFIING